MNLSDLLPPDRVREIAQQYGPPYGSMTELRMDAINAAAPEIAAAVLKMAARRLEQDHWAYQADLLRQFAKEFAEPKP